MFAHGHPYHYVACAATGQGTSVYKMAIDVLLQLAAVIVLVADGALTYVNPLQVMGRGKVE